MITPIEIQNKEFRRAFRGYSEDEVDDFLKIVTCLLYTSRCV